MKLSSFIVLILLILTFVSVQGWIVLRKFGAPEELVATEAVIKGTPITISTSVSGRLTKVLVTNNQHVSQAQDLLIIEPTSSEGQIEENPLKITARRGGVITDINAEEGTLVQANERLISIVDTHPESIYVDANIEVPPEKLFHIQPNLAATVWAKYLNDGQPINATVDSVNSEYDANRQIINVRLRLSTLPSELDYLPLGIPVDVSIQPENTTPLQETLQKLSSFLSL